MARFSGIGITFAAALLLASAASAQVKVARTIDFAPGVAGEKVRAECELQTRIPAFVQEFGTDVELVDRLNTKSGRALALSITEVHAPGGGAFSGPKWMTVHGKLYDGGKLVGTFRAKRFSSGGAFAVFKGTCDILGRCAKVIGQDVAQWLREPTMDAEIGDAR